MASLTRAWHVLHRSVTEFFADDVLGLAAALAFYTALSISPLVLVVIKIAGVLDPGAQQHLLEQIQGHIGPEGAQVVEAILHSAETKPQTGTVAAALGLATLLFSASGVFAQLQSSLNTIWNVRARPGLGARDWARKRLLSFGMVLSIAFLLLVSLAASTVLSALFSEQTTAWSVLDQVASFAVFLVAFAAMFRYLPDVCIGWRDVWTGAAVTAALFAVGKTAIGIYLGTSSISSVYGAAGSLVVLLLWTYYSALIFFFGAEITQAYAEERHSPIVPNRHAEWVPGFRGPQAAHGTS